MYSSSFLSCSLTLFTHTCGMCFAQRRGQRRAQVCATRGSRGKSPRLHEQWWLWRGPWSALPCVMGKERSLSHEIPMGKVCDLSFFPRGDIRGRNPGLLCWSCLCPSPLLILPCLEEITGLHLIHYQKIPTCNEAGLTVMFYKARWEKSFMIRWSKFLPKPCASLSKMSHFWRADAYSSLSFWQVHFENRVKWQPVKLGPCPGQTELERCCLQRDLRCICVLGRCYVIPSCRLTIQGSGGMTKGITQRELSAIGLRFCSC